MLGVCQELFTVTSYVKKSEYSKKLKERGAKHLKFTCPNCGSAISKLGKCPKCGHINIIK